MMMETTKQYAKRQKTCTTSCIGRMYRKKTVFIPVIFQNVNKKCMFYGQCGSSMGRVGGSGLGQGWAMGDEGPEKWGQECVTAIEVSMEKRRSSVTNAC